MPGPDGGTRSWTTPWTITPDSRLPTPDSRLPTPDSRLAASETFTDERKETAAAFRARANAFPTAAVNTATRVLMDNGARYRPKDFAHARGTITHKRTRPYRPRTNGKVERFNRTLAAERAYAPLPDRRAPA